MSYPLISLTFFKTQKKKEDERLIYSGFTMFVSGRSSGGVIIMSDLLLLLSATAHNYYLSKHSRVECTEVVVCSRLTKRHCKAA